MIDRQKYRSGIAVAANQRSGGPMRDKSDKRKSGINYLREYLEEAEMNYVYAFVYNGAENWKVSSIDDWNFDNIELDGTEKIVGHKKFDGTICKVLQDDSGRIIAVVKD